MVINIHLQHQFFVHIQSLESCSKTPRKLFGRRGKEPDDFVKTQEKKTRRMLGVVSLDERASMSSIHMARIQPGKHGDGGAAFVQKVFDDPSFEENAILSLAALPLLAPRKSHALPSPPLDRSCYRLGVALGSGSLMGRSLQGTLAT